MFISFYTRYTVWVDWENQQCRDKDVYIPVFIVRHGKSHEWGQAW